MIPPSSKDRIFPIWKPQMMTSTDVVRKIKNKFDLNKVGHCGTLDPFAEGVLIVLSGNKTVESEQYMKSIKTYRTTIIFGEETSLEDTTPFPLSRLVISQESGRKQTGWSVQYQRESP